MAKEPTRLTGTDSRAGEKRGVMRYVLGISLALAIILIGAMVFSYR